MFCSTHYFLDLITESKEKSSNHKLSSTIGKGQAGTGFSLTGSAGTGGSVGVKAGATAGGSLGHTGGALGLSLGHTAKGKLR